MNKDNSIKNDNRMMIIAVVIQTIVFYVFPILSLNISPFGMIISILFSTFVISIVFGIVSNNKIKYFYPIIISIIFIPSVFIFYNGSALIHTVWYLVVSYIGLYMGIIIKKFIPSN